MEKGQKGYGDFYYGIHVPTTLSKRGIIYVHADRLEITASGALIAWSSYRCYTPDFSKKVEQHPPIEGLILPCGYWKAAFAASCLDGEATATEHWERR